MILWEFREVCENLSLLIVAFLMTYLALIFAVRVSAVVTVVYCLL